MAAIDPLFASAKAIGRALGERQLSCQELLDVLLGQVRAHNPTVNAICTLDQIAAYQHAREADAALARGESWGPLHGVPITIKDSFATRGIRTALGSPTLEQHIPAKDSTVVARLRQAGAIVLGKTNVPEGLCDWQTDNPLFGRTCNPWNHEHTAGGSSGGSAAALAAGFSALDVGSDYGGSIRVPASFCGVYGFKPSERRVPQTGQIHLAEQPGELRLLNAIGPLARSADDLLLAFQLLAGPDGQDIDVAPVPVNTPPTVALRSLKIAWTVTFPGIPVAEDISRAIVEFAHALQSSGAHVAPCFPEVDIEDQWLLREQLRDQIALAPGHGAVKHVSVPEYMKLLQRRDHFVRLWEEFFKTWDLFLCPVAMTTAFPHCSPGTPQVVDGQLVEYRRLFLFSTIFNCTGHPAVVLPLTRDRSGLPIGLQVVGPLWQDEMVLARANALAQIIGPFSKPPGY